MRTAGRRPATCRRCCSQHLTAMKPASRKRASVSRGPAKTQGDQPTSSGARSRATASMTSRTWLMFPSPPHWISSFRGAQRPREPRPQTVVIGHPVKRRRRDDRIHRLVKLQGSSTSSRHTTARSPSRSRARVTMSGEASIASTRPRGTSASSASVTRPVPHPTSSTVASGARARAVRGRPRPMPAAAGWSGHTSGRPMAYPP